MSNSSLDGHLELLCGSLSLEDSLATVKTLTKIVQNALDHPGEERYRQLILSNKTVSTKVWKYVSAQEFMLAIGWVQIDGTIVLPSDDLLPDALIALAKAQSVLDIVPPPSIPPQTTTSSSTAQTEIQKDAYQQRMREMREQMKHAELEKKRISERIKADRRETDQRKAQASRSTHVAFGSRMTTFGDIGVDLNKGGG
ncbi:UBX domain-containing protein 6-like [Halichondria panicea]|uniref:UBX domain-containing protein 6-like n=1 Tax=Halichondria panicea TaxID=6063 RepID=UPI00312B8335